MANRTMDPTTQRLLFYLIISALFAQTQSCVPNLCENGAKCTQIGSDYNCSCPIGFLGKNCEYADQCLSNPCKNGATCTMDETCYKCVCPAEYYGMECQFLDYCFVSNPCQNGGNCTQKGSSFTCDCPIGWHGNLCDEIVKCTKNNPCNPCELNMTLCNQINCIGCCKIDNKQITFKSNNEYYYNSHCDCGKDFHGSNCDWPNLCSNPKCGEKGNCREVGVSGKYECDCEPGFRGNNCEKEDENICTTKYTNSCGDFGTCDSRSTINQLVCNCDSGYHQRNQSGPCVPDPCQNLNIHCQNGGYKQYTRDYISCTCRCHYGYHGRVCEYKDLCSYRPSPCGLATIGECTPYKNDYSCSCYEGFHGRNCQYEDPCATNRKNPCRNGGTCERSGGSDYHCVCLEGFLGRICETRDPCYPNMCRNHGICIREGESYSCECSEALPFEGVRCDELNRCRLPRDECDIMGSRFTTEMCYPCQIGGICAADKTILPYSYNCTCEPHLIGEECQFRKGIVHFHYPLIMRVGREDLFLIIVEEEGDDIHLRIDLGNKFIFVLDTNNLIPVGGSVEEVLVGIELAKFGKGAKYFAFHHRYRVAGEFNVSSTFYNGDLKKSYEAVRNLQGITVISPNSTTGLCLPTVELQNCGYDSTGIEIPKYRRTARFVISASLQIQNTCLSVDKFNHEWSLFRLNPVQPFPNEQNQKDLDHITGQKSNESKFVEFKPQALPEGIYWLEVEFFPDGDSSGEMGIVDYCYFEVVSEPPLPNIVGGQTRTIDPARGAFKLDASFSTDPSHVEKSNYLEYEWTFDDSRPCEEISNSPCDSSIINIDPARLTKDEHTFQVRVRNPVDGRSAFATQKIMLRDNSIEVEVSCLKNCEVDGISGRNSKVILLCSSVDQRELDYTGEMDYRLGDVDQQTKGVFVVQLRNQTLTNEPVFTCKAEDIQTNQIGSTSYRILLNPPTIIGNCTLEPSSGNFLVTAFSITCVGFKSENNPLLYIVYAKPIGWELDVLDKGLIIFHDTKSDILDLSFPIGHEDNEWNVEVFIEVLDSRGDLVQVPKIVVQVLPPDFTSLALQHQISHKLDYRRRHARDVDVDFSNKLRSLLIRQIKGGDDQRALQLILSLLHFLASASTDASVAKSLNDEEKFVDFLAVALLQIPQKNPLRVMQLNQAVHLITLRNHVSDVALNASAQILAEAANHFAAFVANDEVISAEDISSYSRISMHSARYILREGSNRGRKKLEERNLQAKLVPKNVEFLADQNYVDREYFGEDHEDILESVGNIDRRVNQALDADIQLFAKITEMTYFATEKVLETIAGVDFISSNETGWSFSVQTRAALDIPGKSFMYSQVMFKIPSNAAKYLPSDGSHLIRVMMTETNATVNPFFHDLDVVIFTPVASIVLKDHHSQQLTIEFGRDAPIDIFLPFANSSGLQMAVATQLVNVPLVKFSEIEQSNAAVRIFHLSLTPGSKLNVTVTTENRSDSNRIEYVLAVVKDFIPEKRHFCSSDENVTQILNDTKTYHEFDVGSMDDLDESTESLIDFYVGVWPLDKEDNSSHNITYRIGFIEKSCFIRDEDMGKWVAKGCEVGDLGNSTHLHCRCRHLSIFAGGVFVPPNKIDIVEEITLPFELYPNMIIPITVAVIFTFYIMLLVQSILKDNHLKFSGITVLTEIGEDVNCTFYLITVYTGSRRCAGTTANVSIQIYGANGRSDTYVLKDHTLSVFDRGGIDSFLISSVKDLGDLDRIRIWHDHSGTSPDWFLRKVTIKNIKTESEWHFLAWKWLSMSLEHDAAILREIHASSAKAKNLRKRFGNSLIQFRERLVDAFDIFHLWLSPFVPIPSSRFTRAQRLSCAVAVLTSYMIFNILLNGVPPDDYRIMIEADGFSLKETIIISIETALCALPLGLLLVFCFQGIRRRRIPTLIIWKNGNMRRRKQGLDEIRIFQDQRIRLVPATKKIDEGNRPFSIPATDIKDTEKWITSIAPQFPKEPILSPPEICVRKYPDERKDSSQFPDSPDDPLTNRRHAPRKNSDETRQINDLLGTGQGRLNLIEKIRKTDPNSFIYSGNNDTRRVEELIDEDIKRRAEGDWNWLRNLRIPKPGEERPSFLAPVFVEESPSYVGIGLELFEVPHVKKKCCYFPWWWIYVAWTLCICVIIAASSMTVFYGLRYGHLASWYWLARIGLSFLESFVVFQLLFVFMVASVLACCFKKCQLIGEDRFQIQLLEGDEDIGNPKPLRVAIFRPFRSYPPLSGYDTFKLRIHARRRNPLRMGLASICFHILLMIFIIVIAHSTHSYQSFRITDNLRNMLELHEHVENCADCTFAALETEIQLYDYLSDVFLPIVNPLQRYDGSSFTVLPRGDVVMLKDEVNILIGVTRLRQVRLQNEDCKIHKNLKELLVGTDMSKDENVMHPDTFKCTGLYHASAEERESFNPNWMEIKDEETQPWSSTNDAWNWKDEVETGAVELSGVLGTYGGGGYVAELGNRYQRSRNVLGHLKKLDWIDSRTRAVFIEFLVYNPNVNLFADVVLIVEKSPSEALRTRSKITTLELEPPDRMTYAVFLIISHILVFIFLLILIYLYFKSVIYRWRLSGIRIFKRFWLWMDLAQILLTAYALGIAMEHAFLLQEFRAKFDSAQLNEFTSLQPLAVSSVKLRIGFAAAAWLCVVKLWKLLVFSFDRFYILTLALRLTTRFLVGFAILLFGLIFVFAVWGYLAFGSVYMELHTLRDAFMELVNQLLRVTFYSELNAYHRILGPLFFLLYATLIIIGLCLIIAILNQGLREAKEISRQRQMLTTNRNWNQTYWMLVKNYYYQVFPHRHPYRTGPHDKLTIHPLKYRQMRISTAGFMRDCIAKQGIKRMKEMEAATNVFLTGTGSLVVLKQTKREQQLGNIRNRLHVNESKMDGMRLCTINFIRRVRNLDFKVKDFKAHAEYRAEILRFRLKKICDKVELIGVKIGEIKKRRQSGGRERKSSVVSWRNSFEGRERNASET